MLKKFAHIINLTENYFLRTCSARLLSQSAVVLPHDRQNIINDYVPNQNLRLLLVWSGALLAIYVVKAGLNYFIQYWGHIVGVRIQGDMRRDVFRHLQKLPFSYFDETKTGTIMSRMINDH